MRRGRAAARVALGWIAVLIGAFTLWITADAGLLRWVTLMA